MSDWPEMSRDCLKAAKNLLDHQIYRRSISSSYYAAYAAITSALVSQRVTFAHGWNNPAHDQVPYLVLNNLSLKPNTRYEINKAIRRLRLARENADYRPKAKVERIDALNCIHDARLIMGILEIGND